LPELDFEYKHTEVEAVHETKPYRGSDYETRVFDEEDMNLHYYPGFELMVMTFRDPSPKMVKAFLPALLLGVFLIATFSIPFDETGERLLGLGVVMLSYIKLMQ